MLDNATKVLIDTEIDILLSGIEEAVTIGVLEDMSPNDNAYDEELDARWESAMVYLDKKLGNYR
jgi:hypothetical protein